jgi:hypothetical protein
VVVHDGVVDHVVVGGVGVVHDLLLREGGREGGREG